LSVLHLPTFESLSEDKCGDPGLVACNSTPCSQLDEDLTPSLPPLPLEGGEDEGEEEISRE